MTDDPAWRAGALIYSGRPDPWWSVTPEQAAAWVRAFESLTKTPSPAPSQARLGYRGVWLAAPDGRRWSAFLSVAWSERDRRADVDRRLERLLLASAPRGALPEEWETWLDAG